ncbi:NPHS1 family protein [Megaselia abdita]
MDYRGFWIMFLRWMIIAVTFVGCQGDDYQRFKQTPEDIQVMEGKHALLHCEVENQVGPVQWTKDGFALGFSAVITGFPRYSVIGDARRGIYNLRISNASLEDDAEYQCQVGPAKGHPAIRANAKMLVIAPPKNVRIEGYENNARMEVSENQNVSLKCQVENAKPAAVISWYKGDVEIRENINTNTQPNYNGRFATISRLDIQPTSEDDYKTYTCQAKHPALPTEKSLKTSVQLSVLYPPGLPFIEGYTEGETIRRGQKMEIICRSRGGNPPAELAWYKNDDKMPSIQRTSGRLSENVYKFTADDSDNDAVLRCEAKNLLSTNPISSEIKMSVLFSPSEVVISGITEAKTGDVIPITCTTAPSNPPAEIHWTVGGKQVRNSTSTVQQNSNGGGWITTSQIAVAIEPNKRSIVAVCHGLNMQLTENIVKTHTINVLYPPSPPMISGYTKGQIIAAGSIHKLLCVSSGGNPPPTMVWYKNDKKINSVTKIVTNSVSAEITILANATDNQARYKCEVQNSATEIPFFETKTLDVHFPPEIIKIRSEPVDLRPGAEATLICDSSSSNPSAVVSWWKDGIPVEGVNPTNKPGLWGGIVSTLELKVNITQEMNGMGYTCQGTNEVLQRSVHESINLNVLYPPKFEPTQQTDFNGDEGQTLKIELSAFANPMTMTYVWSKDGALLDTKQRIISDGPNLIFSKLHRKDAGTYTCEAMNSQGTATFAIKVSVEYAATIISTSNEDEKIWTQNSDAMVSCSVSGNPLKEEHIRWQRNDYDISSDNERIRITYSNGTSRLYIANVERNDVGNFTCIADNGKGASSLKNVMLLVEFAPEINKSPQLFKYATKIGERGILKCLFESTPEPRITWQRDGTNLAKYSSSSSSMVAASLSSSSSRYNSKKFKTVLNRIDGVTYESILYIEKVTSEEDYGEYECLAENKLGRAAGIVQFHKPSKPDMPLNIWVKNMTDSWIKLQWTPGFNGGLQVYYRVRYRELKDEKYKYVDVRPTAPNVTIHGLKSNTPYLFSVMAANEAGGSKYLPDIKKTMAKGSEPISAELLEKSEMPNLVIIGITSAAMILLVLNAALVAWFVTRKQNKDSTDNDAPNDDVYSKDDNQSDYKESNQKKAASTYLVENVDIIQSASFPPKYQEQNPINSSPYGNNMDYTRTLPNPKRLNKNVTIQENRTMDDHMLVSNGLYIPSSSPASSLVIKGNYMPSPSPAPPTDGSYFNMSDKYLSYPPIIF